MMSEKLIATVCVGAAIGLLSVPFQQPAQPEQLSDSSVALDSIQRAQLQDQLRLQRWRDRQSSIESSQPIGTTGTVANHSNGLTIREAAMLIGGIPQTLPPPPMPQRSYEAVAHHIPVLSNIQLGMSNTSKTSNRDAIASSGAILSQHTAGVEFSSPNYSSIVNTPEVLGVTNIRTGQYYPASGTNGFVDPQTGTFYAKSGQNGVIDTRTGAYIPIAP